MSTPIRLTTCAVLASGLMLATAAPALAAPPAQPVITVSAAAAPVLEQGGGDRGDRRAFRRGLEQGAREGRRAGGRDARQSCRRADRGDASIQSRKSRQDEFDRGFEIGYGRGYNLAFDAVARNFCNRGGGRGGR
jgi:hypothetical protein